MIETPQDLVAALTAAGSRAERETLYAEASPAIDRQAVDEAAGHVPWRVWLVHRLSAGPVGEGLPDDAEALAALACQEPVPTPAHAYRAVYWKPGLPVDALLPLFHNAMVAAIRTPLGSWLLNRLLLVALASGDTEWALGILGAKGPVADPLIAKPIALLGPAASAPEVFDAPVVQRFLLDLYRASPIPSMPEPPPPRAPDPRLESLSTTLAALRACGAVQLAEAVARYAEAQRTRGRLDDHPTVRAIRRAAGRGLDDLTDIDEADLPEGLDEWVKAEVLAHRPRVARVGARLLARHGRLRGNALVITVLLAVRAVDLPLLREHAEDDMREFPWDELLAISGRIPTDVADALVAIVLRPPEMHDADDIGRVLHHSDLLMRASDDQQGMARALIESMHRRHLEMMADTGSRDAVRSWFERIESRLADHLHRDHIDERVLGDIGADVGRPWLAGSGDEPGSGGDEGPGSWIGPVLGASYDGDVDDESVTIGCLLLLDELDAVDGLSAQAERGRTDLMARAATLIGEAAMLGLMELRLRLLHRLLERPRTPELGTGRLYWMIGRAASALGRWQEAVPAFEHAVRLHRAEGQAEYEIDAVIESIRARIALRMQRGEATPDSTPYFDEAEALLELPAQPHWLGKAKANLASMLAELPGRQDLPRQRRLLESALDDLGPEADVEVVTALAATLRLSGEPGAALEHLEAALDTTDGLPRMVARRAMLNFALAQHHGALGHVDDTRRHLDEAIAGMRRSGEEMPLVGMLELRARLLGQEGRIEEALKASDEAAAISRRCGMGEDLRAGLARADLLARAGRIEEALCGLDELAASLGPPRNHRVALRRLELGLETGTLGADGVEQVVRDLAPYDLYEEDAIRLGHVAMLARDHLSPDATDEIAAALRRHLTPHMAETTITQLMACTGRRTEALQRAREAVDLVRGREQHLSALHVLMTLLPQGDEQTRVALELAGAIGAQPADPNTLADTSQVLRRSAAEGIDGADRMQRAVDLAERALAGARSVRQKGAAADVLAACWLDLQARLGVRDQTLAISDARAMLDRRDLPEPMRSRLLVHIAARFAALGPICHPDGIALAETCLAEGHRDVECDLRVQIREALDATRATIRGDAPRARTRAAIDEPFLNELAPWVIDLLLDRQVVVTPDAFQRGAAGFFLVCQLRQDRADALCTRLVLTTDFPDDATRRAWSRTLAGMVDRLYNPTHRFPRLTEAVAGLPDAQAQSLRVALRLADDAAPGDVIEEIDRLQGAAIRIIEDMAEMAGSRGINAKLRSRLDDALASIERAIELAESHPGVEPERMGQLFITRGNVFKARWDPSAALASYEAAAELVTEGAQGRGRLDKVRADAHLMRFRLGGDPDDAREASRLAQRALDVRGSEHRVPTLLTALMAARAHPDISPWQRSELAVHRLLEIVALDTELSRSLAPPGGNLDLDFIADWSRRADPVHRAHVLQRLRRAWPDAGPELELLFEGLRTDAMSADALLSALRDPVMSTYMQLIMPAGSDMRPDPRLFPPELQDAWREHGPPASSPEALAALARGVRPDGPDFDSAHRPGAWIGRAVLLGRAAERGAAVDAAELRRYTEDAVRCLPMIPDPSMRAEMRLELARLWLPASDVHAPIHDAARAAALGREAMAEAPPGSDARLHALQVTARSTRYRTDGDPRAFLREAESLYGQCIEEARAAGDRFYLVQALGNRAELRIHMGFGDRARRLEQAVEDGREAVRLATEPTRRKALLALGWALNRLAEFVGGPRARTLLEEAADLHDEAEALEGPASGTDWHARLNGRLCRAMQLKVEGRGADVIALWRAFRRGLDPSAPEVVRTTAAHNLAGALARRARDRVDAPEIIALYEEALAYRRRQGTRHLWETLHDYANALLDWSVSPPPTLPVRPDDALDMGLERMREACDAARRLGSGFALARSALRLLIFATRLPSARAESVAEAACDALDDAMASLLASDAQSEEEASACLAMAWRLATSGPDLRTPSGARAPRWFTDGDGAQICRWLLRGMGVEHRRKLARQRKPKAVPTAQWRAWRAALDGGEAVAIDRALDAVRRHDPDFLRGEADLARLRRWLRRSTRSAAVAVVPVAQALLVLVLDVADDELRAQVMRLDPRSWPDIADVARPTTAEVQRLADWLRVHVARPVEERLGGSLHRLIWCAPRELGLAPPTVVWPDSAEVHVATTLALPGRGRRPRPRRTLLLGADAEGTLRSLPEALGMLAGATGGEFTLLTDGRTLAELDHPEMRRAYRGPGASDALLDRQAEHDLIVVLAHGAAQGTDDDALLLVDADGRAAPLTAARIAEYPEAFAGASVLLLSCDAGRSGGLLHRPSGLAGAFLAAGAREVVAPLQTVGLATAVEAGLRLISAFVHGKPLARGLAETLRDWPDLPDDAGPLLGRARDQQKAAAVFVSWVG